MTKALAAALAARCTGPVWAQDAPDPGDYDAARSGFNQALDHRPGLVLAAETSADVAAGVRFAAEAGLAVDLQATGHGAHRAMDGGLLISTRRLTRVAVDPDTGTARVAAGASAGDLIRATSSHGLAAAVGAAPGVGFLSYSLGGGLGLIGRAFGWSADRIRRLNAVTADGRELVVTADQHPDLFWGLRGGGGNLAAVTEIEVDLLAVPQIYAGGLFFGGEQVAEVIAGFQQCTARAPDQLTLSVAFIAFPDLPVLPGPLRGRFCAHVRVTYLGAAEQAEPLIAPLRAIPALLDTLRPLPFTEIGSVHADPVDPRPVHSDSATLRSGDALEDLGARLEPSQPFMLEVRHLGGALAAAPAVPDAVGHRDVRYNLFTSAYPGADPGSAAQAQRRLYDALGPAGAGGPLRTFLPSQYRDASACYEPEIATRLSRLKTTWDPDGVFDYAPSIAAPPQAPVDA